MGGKTDEAKGRVKKAAGEISGDEKLKAEGEKDKFTGKAKQTKEKLEKKFQK